MSTPITPIRTGPTLGEVVGNLGKFSNLGRKDAKESLHALGRGWVHLKDVKDVEMARFKALPQEVRNVYLSGALAHINEKTLSEDQKHQCYKKLSNYLDEPTAAELFKSAPQLLWRNFAKWDDKEQTLHLSTTFLSNEDIKLLMQHVPDEWKNQAKMIALDHLPTEDLQFLNSMNLPIEKLRISSCDQLKNLKGAESFKKLTHLELVDTSIESLTGVENLHTVREVRIKNCDDLIDLSALKGKKLETLALESSVSIKDFSLLNDETVKNSLKSLSLANMSRINNFELIMPLPQLNKLDISGTRISDLKPLNNFINPSLTVFATQNQINTLPKDKLENSTLKVLEKRSNL